jgi:hypothetical protein
MLRSEAFNPLGLAPSVFFESGVTFGAVGMRESVSRGGDMTEASAVSGGSMTPPDCASSFELGARGWSLDGASGGSTARR